MSTTFKVIAHIKPMSKCICFCLSKRSVTFQKVTNALKDYTDKIVAKMFIASSKQEVTPDMMGNIVYEHVCTELINKEKVKDVIIVYIADTEEALPTIQYDNPDDFPSIMDSVLQKDIISYMTEKLIKRVIIENEDLSKDFTITRKKRKYGQTEDVTYRWIPNPYVEFRSAKRAKLFLMHEADAL